MKAVSTQHSAISQKNSFVDRSISSTVSTLSIVDRVTQWSNFPLKKSQLVIAIPAEC
jgi:hypothetical protein